MYHVAVAQRISSSQWCLRSQDRSYPVLAFYVFSCRISPENSGSVKNRRCKTCIYPALIREIFSRRGPLSSGVIMCMYGNFTFRLVTVHTYCPFKSLYTVTHTVANRDALLRLHYQHSGKNNLSGSRLADN